MKKIHKKAAALLFAVTVAGVPLGTAFLGSTVGANVFAQATEMASAKCQPVSVLGMYDCGQNPGARQKMQKL